MGSFFRSLKRKAAYEFSCVDIKLVAILSAVYAAICILTSIINVKGAVYKKFVMPKLAMPPFFIILFWIIASALLGAVLAIVISSPVRNTKLRLQAIFSNVCAFVLSCAWIALVYSAKSFVLGALVCAVIVVCLWVQYLAVVKINGAASLALIICAVWLIYVFYFSVSLAFVS